MNKEKLFSKLRDPKFYLENFCQIKSKNREIVPFILNEAQKDLFNTLIQEHRIIILKARQLGFSTAVTGFFYHDTIMNPGTTTVIIGYNREMTIELLEKIKLFYKTTPVEMRPTIHFNSRYEMSFPTIESKILVLPSTETVGRGYTINNLHCTELAMWDKSEEKMTALEAAVPINGRIVVESTPQGIGNTYHEMWVSPDNGYVKKEYGWWWGYSEEEIEVIKKRINNPQKFAQEYGLEFLSSGRMVFDKDAILRQRQNIWLVGREIEVIADPYGRVAKHKVGILDELRIYKPPVPEDMYVCGVDTSGGQEGGDYAVAVILNRRTGEEVAFYRGLISPDKLASKLNAWGRKYNNAMMVVEINNHGLTTLTELKHLLYPNLYFRPSKFDTMSQGWTEKMGWLTTRTNKPFLIDDLGKAIREDALIFHSKEILDEMLTYVYNENNEMEPVSKKYKDDTVMASAMAYQGFKLLYDKPLDQLSYERYLPGVGY